MIGGSAGGLRCSRRIYIYTYINVVVLFLFFKGQATAAICIQENIKCKFIAKEIRSDHDREGHVCIFFLFLTATQRRTRRRNKNKSSISCNLVDYSIV